MHGPLFNCKTKEKGHLVYMQGPVFYIRTTCGLSCLLPVISREQPLLRYHKFFLAVRHTYTND